MPDSIQQAEVGHCSRVELVGVEVLQGSDKRSDDPNGRSMGERTGLSTGELTWLLWLQLRSSRQGPERTEFPFSAGQFLFTRRAR